MNTSQCHTSDFKYLVDHVYFDSSLQKERWLQPNEYHTNGTSFRSQRSDRVRQPLSSPFLVEEFEQFDYPEYKTVLKRLPSDPSQNVCASQSDLTTSWSSGCSSLLSSYHLDEKNRHLWLNDFEVSSTSSPQSFLSKTPPFLDHPRLPRYQPQHIYLPSMCVPVSMPNKAVGTTNSLNTTSSDNWERVFGWYDKHNSDNSKENVDSSSDISSGIAKNTSCRSYSTVTNVNMMTIKHLNDNKVTDESQQSSGPDLSTFSNKENGTKSIDESDSTSMTAVQWHDIGLCLQESDHDRDAISAFRNALNLDATLLDTWLALAISYTNEHERGAAYDCLEAWLRYNDKYQSVISEYNDHLPNVMKDRHSMLVEQYLKTARNAPGGSTSSFSTLSPTTMDADVQVILGILFYLGEDMEKSRDCFQSALYCRPADYRLWNQLGSIWMSQSLQADDIGRSKAIEMYTSALDLNPTFVRARYNLAIAHMKLAQYKSAAHHLVTALSQQQEQQETLLAATGLANNGAPSSIWASLRLVMYMLNMDKLAEACNQYTLAPFKPFLNIDCIISSLALEV